MANPRNLANIAPNINSSSTGSIVLKGASTSADGVGITFPATQAASTDANTLDDYEEGTWTPTITSGSGSFTTVTSATGVYTKIGRIVTCSVTVNVVSAGTAANAIFVTFPFSAATASAYSGSASEYAQTGWACSLYVEDASKFAITKYDGSTIIATGRIIGISITYRPA